MAVYLVAGAAGFIGAEVARQLLEQGHQVIGIDNLNDVYDVRLKQWRIVQLVSPAWAFYQVDVCDRSALNQIWKNSPPIDAVISLAAQAGVRRSVENPYVYFETNVMGTLNLLELCRTFEVKKFVLASSSSCYGDSDEMPFREDASASRPLSPYAASKKSAEVLCYSYHHLYHIDMSMLRFFTVYGPAGRPDMGVFRFIRWISHGEPVTIYGDGTQSRDFTYVGDIARGVLASLQPVGYEIINLGSDHPVVLSSVIQLIEQALGKTANLHYKPAHSADVSATWANVDKARQLLNWSPQISLEEGIRRVVEWYLQNQALADSVGLG